MKIADLTEDQLQRVAGLRLLGEAKGGSFQQWNELTDELCSELDIDFDGLVELERQLHIVVEFTIPEPQRKSIVLPEGGTK